MARKEALRRKVLKRRKGDISVQHQRLLIELRLSGKDPISLFCSILANERATVRERKEAAAELLPYYHPKLSKMGPLLRRFLCDQR